jgi:hypothetical protein
MGYKLTIPTGDRLSISPLWTPEYISTFAWYDAADPDSLYGSFLHGELDALNLSATGSTNPATGERWKAGDQYRLVFACDNGDGIDATSSYIATYDNHIMNVAANSSTYGDLTVGGTYQWKAIASTATVNAVDHTETSPSISGIPVVLINGPVSFSDYAAMWSGSTSLISNRIDRTVEGTIVSTGWTPNWGNWTGVWTGTGSIGATSNPLGSSTPRLGLARAEKNFIFSRATQSPNTGIFSLYGISPILTIKSGTGGVSQIDDKSGNDRHATQSTGSLQPSVGARTINNRNVLNFDPLEYMNVPSFDFMGKELYAVALMDDIDDFEILGSTSNMQVSFHTRNREAYPGSMRIWGNSSYLADTKGFVGQIVINTPYIGGWFAHDPKSFMLNGTVQVTTDAPRPGRDLPIKCIMNNQYNKDQDGLIAEIIVIDGVSTTNTRQRIEGYLAHKWGLASNLPIGHPYKSTPPTL